MTSPEPTSRSGSGACRSSPDTFEQALDRIDRLIAAGRPSFFITANLNYAMLADADPRLKRLNEQAAFLLADGMPLVWWSRLGPRPLPERVAGSDLIYGMCERAAAKGHRIYLLGRGPGRGRRGGQRTCCKRTRAFKSSASNARRSAQLTADEEREQIDRIRAARPDILFVAFGQPQGRNWIAERLDGSACRSRPGWGDARFRGRPRAAVAEVDAEDRPGVGVPAGPGAAAAGAAYLDNIEFLVRAVFAARFRRERRSFPCRASCGRETCDLSLRVRQVFSSCRSGTAAPFRPACGTSAPSVSSS